MAAYIRHKIEDVCKYYQIQEKMIPKVLIYTKVLTYVPFTFCLVGCYAFRPTKLFLRSTYGIKMVDHLKTKYPQRYEKVNNFVHTKIKKISESKVAMFIPKVVGLQANRFTKSFLETIIIYKITLPITVPMCFLSAIYLVKNKHNLPSSFTNFKEV